VLRFVSHSASPPSAHGTTKGRSLVLASSGNPLHSFSCKVRALFNRSSVFSLPVASSNHPHKITLFLFHGTLITRSTTIDDRYFIIRTPTTLPILLYPSSLTG
jgi:hypothetical protein